MEVIGQITIKYYLHIPPQYSHGGIYMEERLCQIDFIRTESNITARLQSQLGGLREFTGDTFEEVLEQVYLELMDEFEGVTTD